MGGILIKALVEKHQLSPERVRATVAHEARAKEFSKKLGVKSPLTMWRLWMVRTSFWFA